MHVLIDARMAGSTQFGIGRYVINLIKNLPKIDKELRLSILVNDDFFLKTDEQTGYFTVIKANIKWLSISEQLYIPSIIRKIKPDVFHAPSFAVPVIQPCPTVVTIHDLIHLLFPEHYSLLHKAYYGFFLKTALKNAARIITVSQSSKKDLLSHYNIPDAKIEVTYEGVEDSFRPIHDKNRLNLFKNKYHLPDQFILYVGNRKKHKNLERLVEAYSKFRKQDESRHYLVLSGLKDKNVERLAFKHKVKEWVVFSGHVDEEEMPLLYNSANLFVFPSLYEGFGLPPLEALACGVPVITSNAASLPEIIGGAGMLVCPQNSEEIAAAMSKVLSDKVLRKELIEKGMAQAGLFSWEECARKTLMVYRRAA
jgi:glycosyltransferase involved in cell wall biosynthesis